MNYPIRFKTDRIESEWSDPKLDNRLPIIATLILGYIALRRADYEQSLYLKLTDVYRTDNEQKAIYGPDYKTRSTHQEWRAFDCIIELHDGTNLSDEFHVELSKWLNENVKYCKQCKYQTSTYHDVKGIHLHVQVYYWDETCIPKKDNV